MKNLLCIVLVLISISAIANSEQLQSTQNQLSEVPEFDLQPRITNISKLKNGARISDENHNFKNRWIKRKSVFEQNIDYCTDKYITTGLKLIQIENLQKNSLISTGESNVMTKILLKQLDPIDKECLVLLGDEVVAYSLKESILGKYAY